MVKLLVSHGAEVTCKDKKAYTPLHAAASSGMISVVKYLLDLGVDVSLIIMTINYIIYGEKKLNTSMVMLLRTTFEKPGFITRWVCMCGAQQKYLCL